MVWLSRLRVTLALLMVLLGTLHCVVSGNFYTPLSLEWLWFISGGIAMICVALGNLHNLQTSRRQLALLALQNILMLGFFITLWLVLPAIQVMICAALITGLLLITLTGLRRSYAIRS